jgi:uncharacterized protein (DUF1330 family)
MIVTCKIDLSKKTELKHYLLNARPVFEAHGGKPLGQYAVAESGAGECGTTHVIIMEFPSTEAIHDMLAGAEYVKLIPARTLAFPQLNILISTAFNPAALLQAA